MRNRKEWSEMEIKASRSKLGGKVTYFRHLLNFYAADLLKMSKFEW